CRSRACRTRTRVRLTLAAGGPRRPFRRPAGLLGLLRRGRAQETGV
ncbi:MAG: hypothetical protein AVDCRST_MAG25-2646, partial [uncultured Rubrobacteraceae bacterium]